MVFHPKVDSFFIKFILIVVLIIGAATFWPLFIEGGDDFTVVLILVSAFIIINGFILWSVLGVKYVFL